MRTEHLKKKTLKIVFHDKFLLRMQSIVLISARMDTPLDQVMTDFSAAFLCRLVDVCTYTKCKTDVQVKAPWVDNPA